MNLDGWCIASELGVLGNSIELVDMAVDVDGAKENPPECIIQSLILVPRAFHNFFNFLIPPRSERNWTNKRFLHQTIGMFPFCFMSSSPNPPANTSRVKIFARRWSIFPTPHALRFSFRVGRTRSAHNREGWSKCWWVCCCWNFLELTSQRRQSAEKFSQATELVFALQSTSCCCCFCIPFHYMHEQFVSLFDLLFTPFSTDGVSSENSI